MATTLFDPLNVFCADWKKIYDKYDRHLDFESLDDKKCPECQSPASKRCGGCHKVSYCKADHQKSHWVRIHRDQCCPFRITTDPKHPELGRFVVAARDLQPGDIIIEELPITVGPRQFVGPVCLACYRPATGQYRCRNCEWPMCSDACCQAPIHQMTGECFILSGCSYKPEFLENKTELSIYEFITALRCVLIKKVCPENWNVLRLMEQHTDDRIKDPFYKFNQINIVKFMKNKVLPHLEDFQLNKDEKTPNILFSEEVSEDEINTAIDVLDVNAFEIRGTEFSIRGVYPLTAMMNSVCNPNTQNCIGSDFTCKVRAAVPIRKGEEITSTYTLTLAGNLYRRQHLKESKYFDCKCKRCSSPTELGSHFSTLICQNISCNRGYVTMVDSLDYESDWKCCLCSQKIETTQVKELIEKMEDEVANLQVSINDYEEQLVKNSKILHPNHHINIDLKYTLVQLYGRLNGNNSPGDLYKVNLRKKELCLNVLEVMDLIIPGHFRSRGFFLCELFTSLLYISKYDYEDEKIDKTQFVKNLGEAETVLDESIQILGYEPPGTVEAAYHKTAIQSKAQLKGLLKALES